MPIITVSFINTLYPQNIGTAPMLFKKSHLPILISFFMSAFMALLMSGILVALNSGIDQFF
jgi:hypothetical protein